VFGVQTLSVAMKLPIIKLKGNRADGVFFHECAFVLVGSCETPRSSLWLDLPPEPEIKSPLANYIYLPDMPVE